MIGDWWLVIDELRIAKYQYDRERQWHDVNIHTALNIN